MYKIEDYKEFFCLYFKEFKEFAPKKFVSYGGYDTGLPNGTACSLEALVFFANIVNPEGTIVNAGAGVSSFILRKMFKNVICTDDNLEYLNTVKELCGKHGLSTDNFIHNLENINECDYMFYDYGEFFIRMPKLHLAVSKTKKCLFADDGDDRPNGAPSYRVMLHNIPNFFPDFSVKDCPETIDQYGRWGILLERKQN